MKTWQMIKELTENPDKKFEAKGVRGAGVFCFVEKDFKPSIHERYKDIIVIEFDGEKDVFRINHVTKDYDWEEVKESVDFMTAVKSGNKVRVEHELVQTLGNNISRYPEKEIIKNNNCGKYQRLSLLLGIFTDYMLGNGVEQIILDGKWYIEE